MINGKAVHKLAREYSPELITFVCIGTDRSTGDSFGPLVGTELHKLGYNVIGTLDEPVHAMNLTERLKEVPIGHIVVAIDACLGNMESVGLTKFSCGPLKPGEGVGKDLQPVGDYNIKGIVNVGGFMEYFVLQNTRLFLVMQMVQETVNVISAAIPLPSIAAQIAATMEYEKQ